MTVAKGSKQRKGKVPGMARTAKAKSPGSPQMGNAPKMGQMLKQVQEMQLQMQQAQEQLGHETVEASAGGGMVSVVVSGDLQIKSVSISPEAVDPDDVEMLADMVLAAVNEGLRAAQELAAGKIGGATGDLDLGDLGLPGLQL
jgi:nucleoid-associated protein EbfC